MKEYYKKNSESIRAKAKKWYSQNKERAKTNAKKNAPKYRERKNQLSKIRWAELRKALITQVSNGENKCKRCGFSDIRALQVDHVNGGGRKEVNNVKFRNPFRYGKQIALAQENYQILCANCNWIKSYEKNERRKISQTKE